MAVHDLCGPLRLFIRIVKLLQIFAALEPRTCGSQTPDLFCRGELSRQLRARRIESVLDLTSCSAEFRIGHSRGSDLQCPRQLGQSLEAEGSRGTFKRMRLAFALHAIVRTGK